MKQVKSKQRSFLQIPSDNLLSEYCISIPLCRVQNTAGNISECSLYIAREQIPSDTKPTVLWGRTFQESRFEPRQEQEFYLSTSSTTSL